MSDKQTGAKVSQGILDARDVEDFGVGKVGLLQQGLQVKEVCSGNGP